MRSKTAGSKIPSLRVVVAEKEGRTKSGWRRCLIGKHIQFSADSLQTYFFSSWNPIVYDALLVAAAVEFCDRSKKRPIHSWGRNFELCVPVHDPDLWNGANVLDSLIDALEFLTGDQWNIRFVPRGLIAKPVDQGLLNLTVEARAVIPFSNGLDSLSVAGLMSDQLGDGLVRIHMGPIGQGRSNRPRVPFVSIPYNVAPCESRFPETSARSRGFKFAMIGCVAAYLSQADEIIIPESGQGILGPVLVPVGQSYADYRNHPLFLSRMEKFFSSILTFRGRYKYPRIWSTKGETLRAFVSVCADKSMWRSTHSCWQQSRQISVDGHLRQCGICAACMLRRLSVHAAGLEEGGETYAWENLKSPRFMSSVSRNFERRKVTKALREYAIAGTLHLDHLASLVESDVHSNTLTRSASQLSRVLSMPQSDVISRQRRLLEHHRKEWESFLTDVGSESFLMRWACVEI